MLNQKVIWEILKRELSTKDWSTLADIYTIIKDNTSLDKEDMIPVQENSKDLSWQRNVRNVLQSKKKDLILWDQDNSKYKLK
jgi:hypothetical protein